MFANSSKSALSRSKAEEVAIRALAFLASEPDHISRFMALSGLGPEDIAQSAATSEFQVALLDHLMGDEALLLTFCSNENISPELIAPARHALGGR